MEPEGSLPHSQASATCLYPGSAQSILIPTFHFLEIHPNVINPSTPRYWSQLDALTSQINILVIKFYMFRTVPLSIIRRFSLYTAIVYVIQVCWQLASRIRTELILLASCQQTCRSYTITVCTVKNTWWRTEELSETCRILLQIWIWKISASSWLYYKKRTLRYCSEVCFS